jgi:hypothetical protein
MLAQSKPPKPHKTWIDAIIGAKAAFVPLMWEEYAHAELLELQERLNRAKAACDAALRWRQCVNPPNDHAEFMEALDTYVAGKGE